MNMYNDFFVGGQWVTKKAIEERLAETNIVDNIMSNEKQRKGRNREKVLENCSRGLVCEIGIAQAVNGELNPSRFDHTVRNSYSWDVKCGIYGNKLEIKNHQHDWWSYSPKNVQTLAKNIAAKQFDYIVTAKMIEFDDGYEVWPRLVIDPLKFRQYSTRSQYNGGLYWNHKTALRFGDCTMYNSEIISLQNDETVV